MNEKLGVDSKGSLFLLSPVIDDETCEKRLWAMKEQGESNFYMCEISREIVIDATFKGNLSRFINHSCSPNSELQKWYVEFGLQYKIERVKYATLVDFLISIEEAQTADF